MAEWRPCGGEETLLWRSGRPCCGGEETLWRSRWRSGDPVVAEWRPCGGVETLLWRSGDPVGEWRPCGGGVETLLRRSGDSVAAEWRPCREVQTCGGREQIQPALRTCTTRTSHPTGPCGGAPSCRFFGSYLSLLWDPSTVRGAKAAAAAAAAAAIASGAANRLATALAAALAGNFSLAYPSRRAHDAPGVGGGHGRGADAGPHKTTWNRLSIQ